MEFIMTYRAVGSVAGVLLSGCAALGQSLTLIPNFTARGVSADGQVVFGSVPLLDPPSVESDAAIWRGNGIEVIGDPPGCSLSVVVGCNGEGTAFVVRASESTQTPALSYVWRQDQAWLPVSFPGVASVNATCMSRDGRVVGGTVILSAETFYESMVWTEEDGGRLVPGGSNYRSWLQALSADGSKAVGSGASSVGSWGMVWPSTYTWCVSMGIVEGQSSAAAQAMTADGRVAVGGSKGSTARSGMALIWTSGEGLTVVPALSPFTLAELTCVSDDGNFAGGHMRWLSTSPNLPSRAAVVWRRGHGLIFANEYLQSRGVSVSTPLLEVVGVSADGKTIVGTTELGSFIARLPRCGSADFNRDGQTGTDADIEAFFRCLAGDCCPLCDSADFDGDGDTATDADIEAFFRVLGGGAC